MLNDEQTKGNEGARKGKILVTGAFGFLGVNTMKELLKQGYQVAAFDVRNAANEQKAVDFGNQIECFWGDIRKPATLEPALNGCDVVIHLAGILPPMCEKKPDLTFEVNVKGTQTLLEMMKKMNPTPGIIFTSSVTVFGDTASLPPPRVASDPVQPSDTYSSTKIECEKFIRESGLNYVILRLSAAPALKMDNFDPFIFESRPDNRLEFVHPVDATRALVNAISSTEAWGKTLLIGGGKSSQLLYRDFINGVLEAIGIGALPECAFGNEPYYTDWLDTEESQRILQFQKFSYSEWTKEIASTLGPKVAFIKLLRPVARLWVLNKSPFWRAFIQEKYGVQNLRTRIEHLRKKDNKVLVAK